jgi:UDP-N-acetylglucosamine 4,6-dehydratase/5-epimerase
MLFRQKLSELLQEENMKKPKMLITGGTGSLGYKLVEHFSNEYAITIFSRDEDKQSRMMQKFPELSFSLGDVRDLDSCFFVVEGQDVVIHAAALKRIEMCEWNPWESIKTNVSGTYNMVKASNDQGIAKFVYLSTDKACKPINTYGMCKALGEKISIAGGYNCVRYGNVNNSRGSVLPYWKEQAKLKNPIKVTNEKMTRFLIDFAEAIKMIELALVKMDGCIYVPKLDAANLMDIARLFSDDISIIGERPGEKLSEELINKEEYRGRVEEFDGYYKVHSEMKFKEMDLSYTSDSISPLTGDKLKNKLSNFLPE